MKQTLFVMLNTFDSEGALALVTSLNRQWNSRCLEFTDDNKVLIQLPEPMIKIGTGTKAELLAMSNRLFGTPIENEKFSRYRNIEGLWRYMGDYIYVYLLQKADDYVNDEEDYE